MGAPNVRFREGWHAVLFLTDLIRVRHVCGSGFLNLRTLDALKRLPYFST